MKKKICTNFGKMFKKLSFKLLKFFKKFKHFPRRPPLKVTTTSIKPIKHSRRRQR